MKLRLQLLALVFAFNCSPPKALARAGPPTFASNILAPDETAMNILDQFDGLLPVEARASLEGTAAPARRRALLTTSKVHHGKKVGPKHHHTTAHHKQPTHKKPLTQEEQCVASFGTKGKATLVMVADLGSFSGVAEGAFYQANLKHNQTIVGTLCAQRSYGKLAGQDVVLAATGIGPGAAIICLSELLLCAAHIKEILYSGTAGWTPQVGGLLDTDDCSKAQPARQIVRLGDVCVSPYSMNWNCKLADYADQVVGAPNLCSVPQEIDPPSASYLYGDCVFATPDPRSTALSARVRAAVTVAKANQGLPARSSKVSGYESALWKLSTESMMVNYSYSATAPPTIWPSDVCMEVDSQFFYSGSPYDQIARQYISDSLSGNKTNGYTGGIGKTVLRSEVVVVSAMEAVGVMELMTKFNALNGNPKIGYVMVRGASDYLTQPMKRQPNGVWVYPDGIPEADFTSGYAYAIATTSYTVLTYLKSQCGSNSAACGFTVAYPGMIAGA